jgi:hypothetical protein
MANKIFIQQTNAGEPIEVNDLTLYPVARSYRINFPKVHGGILWNRPLAVMVEDSVGNRQVLPVVDLTRLLQIAIFGAGFIISMLTWFVLRMTKNNRIRRSM